MVNEIVGKEKMERMGQGKKRNHSIFPLSAPYAQTYRYGEYAPVKAIRTVPDDGKWKLRIPTDLRSYTLKAPMLQNMQMKQDLFFVPHMAILPNSSDYIITNPVIGDDVPENANTVIRGFKSKIKTITEEWQTWLKNYASTWINAQTKADVSLINKVLKFMIWTETFYSYGSLLNNLEYPMARCFENKLGNTKTKNNFGVWFDGCIKAIQNLFPTDYSGLIGVLANQTEHYSVYNTDIMGDEGISIRTMLCMMRENPEYNFTLIGSYTEGETTHLIECEDFANAIEAEEIITTIKINCETDAPTDEWEGVAFNYEKLIAYQLCCAHFFSNDHIDYIYSAELWRQNMRSIYESKIGEGASYYTRNGTNILYDAISGKYLEKMLNNIYDGIHEDGVIYTEELAYIYNIFSFRRSLRFVDYYTGARSRPLAVGDVSVAVNNNSVSVVDITKQIQMQRFLNAANRAGNRIESYIKEIFGIEPKADMHNPQWLGHTSDYMGNPETENTGADQFEMQIPITSSFRLNSNTKQFEMYFDRYGIMIVIRYFEIPRLYFRGINRDFFCADRFDMFIPEMQYIGDQPIFEDEVDFKAPHRRYFGYKTRDSEFKESVGRAMGGFVYNLPGMVFLADHNRGLAATQGQIKIGPNYIRSMQTEMDEYYNILTGYSLDTYYHFLAVNAVMLTASRPMAFQPQILR